MSMPRYRRSTSSRRPRKQNAGVGGSRLLGAAQRPRLPRFVGADDGESQRRVAVTQPSRRFEDLSIALVVHQPTHDTDDHVGRRNGAELDPGRGHVVRGNRLGVEATEIDAVPEERHLVFGHPDAAQHGDVLRVLNELGVRTRSRQTLQAVDERPLRGRVIRKGIQTVHRVDDNGNSGHPRGGPPVEAGLRIVRVDDVRAEVAKQTDELEERSAVFERGEGACRMSQGDVVHTPPRERIDVGTGRRGAYDLEARCDERLELGTEQQFEADIRRRDVDDSRTPACHSPREKPGDAVGTVSSRLRLVRLSLDRASAGSTARSTKKAGSASDLCRVSNP